jgi:hypothetical protein
MKAGDAGSTMQRLRIANGRSHWYRVQGIDFALRRRVDMPALDITDRV